MEIIVLDNPNAEKKMEKEVQKKTEKLISDISPEKYLVYFPLANILNNLDVEQHFGFLQSNRNFQFNVFDIFSSLVFARAVAPCSKYKTFHDVLPSLFKEMNYSYDQLLDAVEFVGSEYEKLVEIFTVATKENYGTDTSHSFFDCTNFFFEIDKENDFQRRGPSKENKNDSIVGMGLLLDANIIPIGKKMYPGNESEKPILRNIIQDMKNQNNISGRTIQIADKGLNCARNIIQAVNNSDGYIFSKSVKQLSEKEKVWVLLNNDYKDVKDEYGNTVYRYKSCIEDFDYSYKDDPDKAVDSRYLHRGEFNWSLAPNRNIADTVQGKLFHALDHLEHIRSEHNVFDTNASLRTIDTWDASILALVRENDDEKFIGIYNFSDQDKVAWINEDDGIYTDLISGHEMEAKGVMIPAFGCFWLCRKK